jgi:hypothetical protein
MIFVAFVVSIVFQFKFQTARILQKINLLELCVTMTQSRYHQELPRLLLTMQMQEWYNIALQII